VIITGTSIIIIFIIIIIIIIIIILFISIFHRHLVSRYVSTTPTNPTVKAPPPLFYLTLINALNPRYTNTNTNTNTKK